MNEHERPSPAFFFCTITSTFRFRHIYPFHSYHVNPHILILPFQIDPPQHYLDICQNIIVLNVTFIYPLLSTSTPSAFRTARIAASQRYVSARLLLHRLPFSLSLARFAATPSDTFQWLKMWYLKNMLQNWIALLFKYLELLSYRRI